MRTLADLKFIAARVWADVRANPTPGPLLGESESRPCSDACKRGHVGAMRLRPATGRRICGECDRERNKRLRARKAAA